MRGLTTALLLGGALAQQATCPYPCLNFQNQEFVGFFNAVLGVGLECTQLLFPVQIPQSQELRGLFCVSFPPTNTAKVLDAVDDVCLKSAVAADNGALVDLVECTGQKVFDQDDSALCVQRRQATPKFNKMVQCLQNLVSQEGLNILGRESFEGTTSDIDASDNLPANPDVDTCVSTLNIYGCAKYLSDLSELPAADLSERADCAFSSIATQIPVALGLTEDADTNINTKIRELNDFVESIMNETNWPAEVTGFFQTCDQVAGVEEEFQKLGNTQYQLPGTSGSATLQANVFYAFAIALLLFWFN